MPMIDQPKLSSVASAKSFLLTVTLSSWLISLAKPVPSQTWMVAVSTVVSQCTEVLQSTMHRRLQWRGTHLRTIPRVCGVEIMTPSMAMMVASKTSCVCLEASTIQTITTIQVQQQQRLVLTSENVISDPQCMMDD